MQLSIRSAMSADSRAVQHIYAREVLHGTASFDTIPPTVLEMERKMSDLQDLQRLPFLVAVADGKLVGYAYAAPYRLRPAYRYTLETSVYVSRDHRRLGVARALMQALELQCLGARQLVAVIGDSNNEASRALHAQLGFQLTGVLRAVGWKHGRWLDSVIMQKSINQGASTLPPN